MTPSYQLVICLAAYNEAESFPELLAAFKRSDLWTAGPRPQVYVGLNGCTDDSARVLESLRAPDFDLTVLECPIADKNATLNSLIEAASPQAPFLIFVDADFHPHPRAFRRLLWRLNQDDSVDLVTARPVPTLALHPSPTWYQRARVKFSRAPWVFFGSGEATLARANLYAVRSEAAQKLQFPVGTGIMDDCYFACSLGARCQIEGQAEAYFTPPTLFDHLQQRARQRWGWRVFKALYPDGYARAARLPRIRKPALSSPEEAIFFLTTLLVDRLSRIPSALGLRPAWRKVASSRPGPGEATSRQSLRQRLLKPVQLAVVEASHNPLAYSMLKQVYLLVVKLWANAIAPLPGVASCIYSGSLARDDVSPGLSDIDCAVILDPMEPEREKTTIRQVLTRDIQLRRLFPILQEPTLRRKSEFDNALRWGEPWATRTYRTVKGPVLAPESQALENNRDAFIALVVRRFLRFYTRQALAGSISGVERYVRQHPVGLASMNVLLRWARTDPDQTALGEIDFETEERRLENDAVEDLFANLKEMRRHGHRRLRPDLGNFLASRAFVILGEIGAAYAKREKQGPRVSAPTPPEDPDARACRQLVAPLLARLTDDPVLGRFPPLLSSAGVHHWQYRLYLLVPRATGLSEVREAYQRLASIWEKTRAGFPTDRFGVFPNPCLLPEDALSLLHLSYHGSFEPLYLQAHYPDRKLPVYSSDLDLACRRNLAERGYLTLRRLDLPSAPRRTLLRFLDTFCGLLPAVALRLEKELVHLTLPGAARAYLKEFDDPYCEFLGCFDFDTMAFRPTTPRAGEVSRLQNEFYGTLRQRLDQLLDLAGDRAT